MLDQHCWYLLKISLHIYLTFEILSRTKTKNSLSKFEPFWHYSCFFFFRTRLIPLISSFSLTCRLCFEMILCEIFRKFISISVTNLPGELLVCVCKVRGEESTLSVPSLIFVLLPSSVQLSISESVIERFECFLIEFSLLLCDSSE